MYFKLQASGAMFLFFFFIFIFFILVTKAFYNMGICTCYIFSSFLFSFFFSFINFKELSIYM